MSAASTQWEIWGKERERNGYENRKNTVQGIKNDISNRTDDWVRTINSNMDKLKGYLESGVTGISVTDLVDQIEGKKEKYGTNDTYLSSYDINLACEISDCNSKINDLNNEIAALNARMAEERRQEEEAARALLESIFG